MSLSTFTFYANPKAVKLLIESGADKNLKDISGNAPLHLACRFGAKFQGDIVSRYEKKIILIFVSVMKT